MHPPKAQSDSSHCMCHRLWVFQRLTHPHLPSYSCHSRWARISACRTHLAVSSPCCPGGQRPRTQALFSDPPRIAAASPFGGSPNCVVRTDYATAKWPESQVWLPEHFCKSDLSLLFLILIVFFLLITETLRIQKGERIKWERITWRLHRNSGCSWCFSLSYFCNEYTKIYKYANV